MTTRALSNQDDLANDTAQNLDFVSTRILEIELSQPLSDFLVSYDHRGRAYQKAMVIVRLHTQPLGTIELVLHNGSLSIQEQAYQIWQALGEQINEHLQQDNCDPLTQLSAQGITNQALPSCLAEREQFLVQAPFASIVVATRDRPEMLQRCLDALLRLHYPRYEIIVVDNAPSTSATFDFMERTYRSMPQVHYLREDRPGPSFARNRGIQEAQGEIIAITDDDVVVDTYWLIELLRGFQVSEKVVCVSGLVLPMELETQAQAWFEQFGGFSKGFHLRLFDLHQHHPGTPLFPYAAGYLGTGANMAFKANYLQEVGGFDPALGPGTLSQGGEDLALLLQTIIQHHTIVYNPAALLYHPSRRDTADLRKQIYNYGVGLTAYLMKIVMDQPFLLFDIASKVPHGLFFTFSKRSPKNRKRTINYPKELAQLELRGMLYGPLAYLRSRWALQRSRRHSYHFSAPANSQNSDYS